MSTAEYSYKTWRHRDTIYSNVAAYWTALQITILACIFCYYFVENFILSESWSVLLSRSIDDFVMQASTYNTQKEIIAGHWKTVFTTFDYAYGNIFWLFNAVLLMPLYMLDATQVQIIAGRQLSLLFVFGSIYLLGLIIDKLRPDAKHLKYPTLIAIATMPMVEIIATKLHVNAPNLFFGILSFFLIVRSTQITRKDIIWSGVSAGVAIGLKVTGVVILPLLGLTLINRLFEKQDTFLVKNIAIFCLTVILVSIACAAPSLFLFPCFRSDLKRMYATFVLFKNMGGQGNSYHGSIVDGLAYYLNPIALSAAAIFSMPLIVSDMKRRNFIFVFIIVSLVAAEIALVLTVHKIPFYIATYLVNLGFFIPLGLIGIATVRVPTFLKVTVAYTIIACSIVYGIDNRNRLLCEHLGDKNFFRIIKSEKIQNRLNALNEMSSLIMPIKTPIRMLQDCYSIFPVTGLTEGVMMDLNFGTLDGYSKNDARYDYISFNTLDYFGRTPANFPEGTLSVDDTLRKTLYDTGYFKGSKYRLIYENFGILVYELERTVR